jgi:hypothetical protein
MIRVMNLPKGFVQSCNAAYNREISMTQWVRGNEPYLKRLVNYHLSKYRAYPCGLTEDDLLSVVHIDAARRLGLWVIPDRDLTWDPDHPRTKPLAEYVYSSGTRACSNAIKQELKIRAPKDRRPKEPIVLIPVPYLSSLSGHPIHPAITRWERDGNGTDTVSVPSEWELDLERRLSPSARPDEIQAIKSAVSILFHGGDWNDVLTRCAIEPSDFAGFTPKRLENLCRYVPTNRWAQNRGPLQEL